jgi:chorismate mutase/prephenate dehydratase
VKNGIERYRRKIDRLDRRVAKLLAKRLEQVVHIGRVKRENEIDVRDKTREGEVLERIDSVVDDGYARRFVRKVFRGIIEESSRVQREGDDWTGQ